MTPSKPVIGPTHLRIVSAEGAVDGGSERFLRYNRQVADLLREVPPENRRAVLRKIEAEVRAWESRRTRAQDEWVRPRYGSYRGTLAATAAILAHLS